MNKVYAIKVPATSANIGSGFDTTGAAFQLYNLFEVCELKQEGLIIKGVPPEYRGKDNLVVKSMERLFSLVDYRPKGLFINEFNDIPMGKGLGSSATCIVAGLVGANLIAGRPFSLDELFEISVRIEGHPDNVAPAFFGGLTTALMSKDKTLFTREEISAKFEFYACIPDFTLSTQKARDLLPKTYSRQDVVYNISHAIMSYLALTRGLEDYIPLSVGDRIHEPYRKGFIEGYDEIVAHSKRIGALASYISGAGPTLIQITEVSNISFEGKMHRWMRENFPNWEFMRLVPDTKGVVVQEHDVR